MVSLRPVEESDFAPLEAIVNEPAVSEWWGGYDTERLREEVRPDHVEGFAIELDGEPIGLVTVTEEDDPDTRYAEVDLFIATVHQGRGLGAEALRQALRFAFEERGIPRAIIVPAAANAAAIRCYEKVGFRRVGIFRKADRGRDALAMDLLREEFS